MVVSVEVLELRDPLNIEVVKNVSGTLVKRSFIPVEVVSVTTEVSCVVFIEYDKTLVAAEDLEDISDCVSIFAGVVLSTNMVDVFVVPIEVLLNCPIGVEETDRTNFE